MDNELVLSVQHVTSGYRSGDPSGVALIRRSSTT